MYTRFVYVVMAALSLTVEVGGQLGNLTEEEFHRYNQDRRLSIGYVRSLVAPTRSLAELTDAGGL
jgi:hypothetical protein